MGKYLHYFQNENDYNTVRENNYVEPWVSATHIQTSYRVDYNKSEDEKLLETPLTFEILGSGNITWNLYSDDTGATTGYTIEYKKNNGEWTEIAAHVVEWVDDETYPDGGYYTGGTEISVNTGDIVLFRGDNPAYGMYDEVAEIESYAFFNSTCQFKVKANIMSLINSTDFSTETTLQSAYTFSALFGGCTGLIDASNLLLPATTLANYCYYRMFIACTNLTTAPELPATTLADSCYTWMFFNCISLTTAPELPATTLTLGCYNGMFQGCTSLTTTPELPATTLAEACYSEMFSNCTGLTTAPELPATTLASSCYNGMFDGCTSLTTAPELPATNTEFACYGRMFGGCTSLTIAPELPATTLANYCYVNMFNGCTSLTIAPELPATTLTTRCYFSMFNGCTSLTTAPELPATTLTVDCYRSMFEGCTNLNYIKCLATNISATYCTLVWVKGVASAGTFVKNPNMTGWESGVSGIPTNWTVQDA